LTFTGDDTYPSDIPKDPIMNAESSANDTTVCTACATPGRSGEKFCATCGMMMAATMVTAPEAIPTTTPGNTFAAPHTTTVTERQLAPAHTVTKQRPGWLLGLTAAAVVIAIALLAVNDAATHGGLAATHRKLSATEATLASTNLKLSSTRTQLTSTQHELSTNKSSLASANSAKAQLRTQLSSTQAQLAGVRGNLSETQNQLNLQAGQLAIVKTCLSGFATALNADLSGDYSSGLAALQSVQTACQEASTLFN
jgi:hypothetical protein